MEIYVCTIHEISRRRGKKKIFKIALYKTQNCISWAILLSFSPKSALDHIDQVAVGVGRGGKKFSKLELKIAVGERGKRKNLNFFHLGSFSALFVLWKHHSGRKWGYFRAARESLGTLKLLPSSQRMVRPRLQIDWNFLFMFLKKFVVLLHRAFMTWKLCRGLHQRQLLNWSWHSNQENQNVEGWSCLAVSLGTRNSYISLLIFVDSPMTRQRVDSFFFARVFSLSSSRLFQQYDSWGSHSCHCSTGLCTYFPKVNI